jgi:hypothetical protein
MHDNDEWAGTDWEYAEGSRLAVVSRGWGESDWAQVLARTLPGIEAGEALNAGFGLTHAFYTPPFLLATAPIPTKRAYGAMLEGSLLLQADTWNRLDTWKFDLGVVGPSAQGEELEKFFHNIFNGRDMEGWDNQIRDRVALNASWERRWRNLFDLGGVWSADVSPVVMLSAGTVETAAGAGVTLRLGSGLDREFGAPRVGSFGGSLNREGLGTWYGYLFASANGKAVGYDVFLDEQGGRSGDPVRAGSAISRKDWRTETSYGFVLGMGPARLTFAMTDTPKLYDQQLDKERYGELTLGWSF